MKVFISDRPSTGRTLGRLEIEIDDATIDAHGMRPAFESIGRAVAEQMNVEGRDQVRGRVVGVHLLSIDFSLLLG